MAKTLFTITIESTASEIHDALLSLALDNQGGRYKHHELQELFNRDAMEADIELVLNENDDELKEDLYKCLDSSDLLTMDNLITYVEEYVDYEEYNDQVRDAIEEFVDRKEELEYIKAEAKKMSKVLFTITEDTKLDELFDFLETQEFSKNINLKKVEDRIFNQDTIDDIRLAVEDDPIFSSLIDRLSEYELKQLRAHIQANFNLTRHLVHTHLNIQDFIKNVLPTLKNKE